tara:strand:+ start:4813 stop:5964 length:1152 start_codon:yes stop_codon:yes gene_type:complete
MKTPLLAALCVIGFTTHAFSAVDEAIATILSVGTEGQGNAEAGAAWEELSNASLEQVPAIISELEGANPLAANYLRGAVDAIVARETKAGKNLPMSELGSILLDPRQAPQARSYAFELIERTNPDTAAKLVPGMLNDPSVDLRRRAVERLIDEAKGTEGSDATLIYRQALTAARDADQVQTIAKALREKEQEVDLPLHFGFLMHWDIIGPFDNTEREGFDTVYPPETEINISATYPGKDGEVSWQPYVTTDEYGKLDFNKPYGLLKDVVAYAYTEFNAAQAQSVELRLGGKNAWKVWLNGELLFGRDEYHRGARIDQYKMKADLREGTNQILVKCCQNEQERDWTVQWEFQLRVCDETGTAVLAQDRPPTPKPEAARRRPKQG